jgi:hypothetical protein
MMYSWIWRHLPGPLPIRAGISAALVLTAFAALWLGLFPWIYTHVPLDSVASIG